MKKIDLYTDGACSGNPGPGGWGAVLIYNGHEKEVSGYKAETTNNQMELMAIIKGLGAINETCSVTVHTDSAYVFNAFTKGWIDSLQKNGWKTANKSDVKNKALWQELILCVDNHKTSWRKVKGHADNKYNNLCDALATGEISKNRA